MTAFAGETVLPLQIPDGVDRMALVRAIRTEAERQGFHVIGRYTVEPSLELRPGRVEDLVRDLEESIVLARLAGIPITGRRAALGGAPPPSGAA